jgi:hypothetical protein
MQKETDSKIQAKVRILLARRWVDLRAVTIGTTNGVVYIGGSLKSSGRPSAAPEEPDPAEAALDGSPRWFQRIRREISEIPEVRDVVFMLGDRDTTGDTCRPKPF